jgi:hypothetical protein
LHTLLEKGVALQEAIELSDAHIEAQIESEISSKGIERYLDNQAQGTIVGLPSAMKNATAIPFTPDFDEALSYANVAADGLDGSGKLPIQLVYVVPKASNRFLPYSGEIYIPSHLEGREMGGIFIGISSASSSEWFYIAAEYTGSGAKKLIVRPAHKIYSQKRISFYRTETKSSLEALPSEALVIDITEEGTPICSSTVYDFLKKHTESRPIIDAVFKLGCVSN